MIRRHDGKNFIGLLNTRVTPTDKKLGLELDRLLHNMVDAACMEYACTVVENNLR